MKKTFSLIYRLFYMILLVWTGIAAGINGVSLYNFTVAADVLFFAVTFLMFIFSLTGKIPDFLLWIKRFCSFLALTLLLLNIGVYSPVVTVGLVLYLLLPFMMFLDYLLFDSKKGLSGFELPAMLIALLLFLLGIWFLTDLLNGVKTNFIDFLNKLSPLNEFLTKLGAAALFFLLLSSLGKGKKGSVNFIMKILTILFLAAEIYALITVSGKSLVSFISKLRDPVIFTNLACFLFVAVSFLYGLLGNVRASALSRLRLYFLFGAVFIFVINVSVFRLGIYPGYVQIIFFYICPVYMILEWLL